MGEVGIDVVASALERMTIRFGRDKIEFDKYKEQNIEIKWITSFRLIESTRDNYDENNFRNHL